MPPPPVGIELVSTCRMHSITYANLMIKRCSTMPIWMLDRPKKCKGQFLLFIIRVPERLASFVRCGVSWMPNLGKNLFWRPQSRGQVRRSNVTRSGPF